MPTNGTTPVRWALLLLLTAALIGLLHLAHLPAAFLLGALGAAICFAARGETFQIPEWPILLAQSILGCMISSVLSVAIFKAFAQHWLLFLAAATVPIFAAAFCGWVLSRLRVLPSSTGVWGALPGAATVMVLMSEGFGADQRLVAFMQYMRVLCVALVASLVGLALGSHGGAQASAEWFPSLKMTSFATAIAIIFAGALLGKRLRFPSGALLLPMVIAAAVHLSGLGDLQLPQWLLVIAYVLLGWNIGLKFTADSLRYAWRSLPSILSSIFALMLFCVALAWALAQALDIDFLTAYLATSPGGADSVAIIAASSHVDISMVMAVQVSRFLFVMLIGPPLAKAVSRALSNGEAAKPA